MEQQKTLWIIFSVALFILVIVGVGVIWFLPNRHATTAQPTAATQSTSQPGISFDPYEWAKTATNNYPGLEQTPKSGSGGNFTIIYGQPQNAPATGPQATVAPSGATGTAVAPPTPQAPRATTATPPVVAPPAPAPVRKAVERVAPAPRPARHLVQVTERWIQVAAYTSDFRAEQARKSLQAKGISSTIMSHQVGSRTFFRVRVGPYASEQEAQAFLEQIKKLQGFKNSYISLVYAYRSAN